MLTELDFSDALDSLKEGHRVAREGWNGKGMYIRFIDSSAAHLEDRLPEELGLECLPYIMMKTADNKLVPWLASQTDILAEDWVDLDDEDDDC